jgi:hypothetical protein
MIKCNTGYMQYLYWNGTSWVRDIKRARIMESRREADRELATLSTPNIADRAARPEVFTM